MNNKQGKLVTFYSYKGGVGRTMSLVNIAALMAKKGKRVLLIDWDLEAPGLHEFFDTYDKTKLGIVDFITNSISDVRVTSDDYLSFFESQLGEFIDHVSFNNEESISVDLIKAGRFDTEYTEKLQAINWLDFYKKSPSFYREFAIYLESQYDYIFVDSRTGLSDTGGICTMLLPQILVTVFALNNQNINGVIDVTKQSLEYRFNSYDDRDLRVLPLPSRIDEQNSEQYNTWLEKYTSKFELLFKEVYSLDECKLKNYFNKAKIPYKSTHAYGENIIIFNEDIENTSFITYHYSEFSKILEDQDAVWDILSDDELQENKKKAQSLFQKAVNSFYENEFKKAIKFFEESIELNPFDYYPFAWLGLAYSKLTKESNGEEREWFYHKAFMNYGKAIELKSDDNISYINWGNDLGKFAATKSGNELNSLYLEACDKFQKSTEIKPDFHEAYDSWGNALGYLAKVNHGEVQENLYYQAYDKFQKSIEIKPDFYLAFNNWGNALGNLAKEKHGEVQENLYHQAFSKFQKSIEIKPDFYLAFNNWGIYLGNFANEKQGADKDKLYHQAFSKFQKSTEMKPDYYEAYSNWGIYLGSFAKEKHGEIRDDLYSQAFAKFQKSIEIKPDFHSAFNYWSSSLLSLFHFSEGEQKELLLEEAFTKASKAYELGGRCYNLACVYALKEEKGKAIDLLEEALTRKEVKIEYVKKDKDWEHYWNDKEFIDLLDRLNMSKV